MASLDNAAIIAVSCFFGLEDFTAEKVRVPIQPLNPSLMTTSLYILPLRARDASSRVLDIPPGAPCFLAASSVPAQSSPRQPTSDISDDDLDGAVANTDPIGFDTSPPCYFWLLPHAWVQRM